MAQLVTAVWAFEAQHESQLSVAANETLTVISAEAEWWVVQRIGGSAEQGYAPAGYLKKVEAEQLRPELRPALLTPRDAEDDDAEDDDVVIDEVELSAAVQGDDSSSGAVRYASWVLRPAATDRAHRRRGASVPPPHRRFCSGGFLECCPHCQSSSFVMSISSGKPSNLTYSPSRGSHELTTPT